MLKTSTQYDVAARVFEATNHPGADVEFIVDGDVIHAVQLKAVASPAAIFEHLARYPDIEIVATEEVAAVVSTASGSGFSNAAISGDVSRVFTELPGDSMAVEIAEGAATSARSWREPSLRLRFCDPARFPGAVRDGVWRRLRRRHNGDSIGRSPRRTGLISTTAHPIAKISPGTPSTARSAPLARSNRFGSLTCGTSRTMAR